jgi:hypothetical protein
MQHDVQEFNRVLQDNLETKMKVSLYSYGDNIHRESVDDVYDLDLMLFTLHNFSQTYKCSRALLLKEPSNASLWAK